AAAPSQPSQPDGQADQPPAVPPAAVPTAPGPGQQQPAAPPQEEPRELALSMDDAVAMALKENARLAIARLEREKARGRIGEAWSTALPNVSGTVTYIRKDEIVASEIMGMSFAAGDEDNWNAEIAVRQNLSLWTSATAIAVAKMFKDWTEEFVRDSEQQTVFLTKKLYLDLLLSSTTLERHRQTLALAQEHAGNIKKLRAQGMATEFDLLRADVEVANIRALVSQSQNSVNVAMISLVRMLGLRYDAQIVPTDALDYAPTETDAEAMVSEALRQRPDLAQALLNVDMQEKNLELIKQQFVPSLSAQYSYGNERPNRKSSFGEPEWEDYWNFMVVLSYPLFEGGLTLSKYRKESAVLRQQELAYHDSVEAAKAETYQAVLGVRDAAEFVESQAENVRQAEESVRLAKAGYESGTNTSLEVLDAQTALSTARANYSQAVYAHCVARIALDRAMGR
ncbi:MAG: TolC family protein, partial [Planctomycetota bacterium]|nr:TolC family protein [Planctomycetota bacterium]